MCGWQVKPCDPMFTCAIPERLRDEQLTVKHYTNEAYFTLSVGHIFAPFLIDLHSLMYS